MKTNIVLILLLFSLYSCEEIGLWENTNDITYLYFSKDVTKDSTGTSFKLYGGEKVISIPVEMTVAGEFPKKDIEFTVSVDEKASTLSSEFYKLPAKCVFRADHKVDTIYINVTNHPLLATQNMRLVLKVDEQDHVKVGPTIYQQAIISVTDRISRPAWWTELDGLNYYGEPSYNIAEEYYLGKYSEKKYLMFLEELDGLPFDGKDRNLMRAYSLKLKYRVDKWNEENAPKVMWDEENNAAMQIPVKG